MKPNIAQELIEKTRQDYCKIAKHFAATRRKQIDPGLKKFLAYVKPGDKILDVGCGNGRLLQLFSDLKVDYTGIDNCPELINEAKKDWQKPGQQRRFLVADALNPDFEESSFDQVFCLTALHHIPGQELQKRVLANLKRVVRPDGHIFLTVWYLWQPRFTSYIWKNNLKKIFSLSKLDFNDLLYPWKFPDGRLAITRYLHAFRKNELEKLVLASGLNIVEVGYIGKNNKKFNIYVVAKKII